ncbi:hypothetical protein E2C01_021754 [Portunus trituberculatus]|uniref:Uncharacterized protein n=1 Tax=Portunus trituberculatus TaxID=210409 RepID=A0A5B7E5S0_PORTR|nr:hypothetical protein [Portunus trituberculatus]
MKGRLRIPATRLEVTELRTAIIRHVQRNHFRDAVETFKSGRLTKKNNLYRLEPYLDDQGLL